MDFLRGPCRGHTHIPRDLYGLVSPLSARAWRADRGLAAGLKRFDLHLSREERSASEASRVRAYGRSIELTPSPVPLPMGEGEVTSLRRENQDAAFAGP